MAIVNFEHPTLIHGRQNVQGVFDADLNPDVRNSRTNADLTLFIRICFQKIDPSGGSNTYNDWDGTAVPIRAWRGNEWTNFKSRFISDCRRRWHGKFWLTPPDSYTALQHSDSTGTYRCNLYCRFDISEQSTTNGAHAVIPVVHVNGNHNFRSHMLLYSNRDLRPENLTRGSRFFTHVHEIGHLIGLDHPGTGRTGCNTGGENVCYAAPDGNNRGVMGMGSQIYARHAAPWQKAAAAITGVSEAQWTASTRWIRPARV